MTDQMKDRLHLDGQTFLLRSEPLNSYIRTHSIKVTRDLNDTVSCCWRGYTADWQIAEGRLWLTGLRAVIKDNDILPRFNFKTAFPVLADWVSDEVVFYQRDELFAISCTVINGTLIKNR